MRLSGYALRPAGVLEHMFLAHFVAILDWLDTLYVPTIFGWAKSALKCATGIKDLAEEPASDG